MLVCSSLFFFLCGSSASGLPKEELHNLLIANGGGDNGCMGGVMVIKGSGANGAIDCDLEGYMNFFEDKDLVVDKSG